MKRTLTLFLALLLTVGALSSLAACSGGGTDPEATTAQAAAATTTAPPETEPPEPSAYDYLPAEKYDGRTYTMVSPDGKMTRYIPGQFITEEATGDIVMDSAYERNMAVEERFGIKLKHVMLEGNFSNAVRTAIMGGESAYDVAGGHAQALTTVSTSDALFYDVGDLKYQDLSMPWYSDKLNAGLDVNGKQSVFFSDFNCITLSCTYGVFCNVTLGKQYNLPDVSTLALEGKWTIDNLLTYTKDVRKDLNGDGVFDEKDQYGYSQFGATTAGSEIYPAFQYGMGQFTTSFDKNGVKLILNTEKEQTIVEKLNKLVHEENRMYYTTNKENTQRFAEGKYLFLSAIIMHAPNYMRDMADDYTVLPMPKFDEAQAEYYTSVSANSSMTFGVPVTVKDKDYSSLIFDALSYEGFKHVIPGFFEVAMKAKYSRDQSTTQVFDLLREGTVVDFGMMYDGDVGMYKLVSKLVSENSTDLASSYAAIEAQANAHYKEVLDLMKK